MKFLSSFLFAMASAQTCVDQYTGGNGMKYNCQEPTCFTENVDYTVVDAWRKKMGNSFKYGWNIKVDVTGKNKTDKKGWSILVRFKGTQGDIQVFNANVRNVYYHNTDGYLDFLFVQKYWLKNDLLDEESFTFVANRIGDAQAPELYYWDNRQTSNKCFQSSTRSTVAFEEAIQKKGRVQTYEDVSKVVVRRTGEMRVDI